MARMHSGSKGKSGSTKPSTKMMHGWIRYKPKEVELLIVKLAKEGNTPSQIGMHLRDTYGIPDVKLITKKKISQILKGKKLLPEIPEDIMDLLRRTIALRDHLEKNHHDLLAKRGLLLTESKIKRLVGYYKKTGRLSEGWKYDPKRVKLLVS